MYNFNRKKIVIYIQLNLFTMAILGTEERACCGEVAVMGRLGCNMTILFREYNIFIVLSSYLLAACHIMVIQSYIIHVYREWQIKYTKKLDKMLTWQFMLNSAVYKWNTAIVGRVKQVRVHVWTVCRDKKEAVVERWQFVEVRLYNLWLPVCKESSVW